MYAIVHGDATDAWPHGNTGVIVGTDGVLVVDATYLPSRARADIALISGSRLSWRAGGTAREHRCPPK